MLEVATSSYHVGMRAVGIKTLKNRLSEFVKLAASGETVLVTDRDRVVAELIAPRPERATHGSAALLEDMVQKGWLTPAPVRSAGPPPRLPVAPTEELLRELDDDRSER